MYGSNQLGEEGACACLRVEPKTKKENILKSPDVCIYYTGVFYLNIRHTNLNDLQVLLCICVVAIMSMLFLWHDTGQIFFFSLTNV